MSDWELRLACLEMALEMAKDLATEHHPAVVVEIATQLYAFCVTEASPAQYV